MFTQQDRKHSQFEHELGMIPGEFPGQTPRRAGSPDPELLPEILGRLGLANPGQDLLADRHGVVNHSGGLVELDFTEEKMDQELALKGLANSEALRIDTAPVSLVSRAGL